MRKAGAVFLAVFVFSWTFGIAAASTNVLLYFNHKSWTGYIQDSNYVVNTNLYATAGSKYAGPVYVSIPWDRLDLASVGIIAHGDQYPLYDTDGSRFFRVVAIGATDYNKGTYYIINQPGVSGYESYTVSFNDSSAFDASQPGFHPAHHAIFIKALDETTTRTFKVVATNVTEAKKEVEKTLGGHVGGVFDILEAGVDFQVTNVYEIETINATTKVWGVEVTFYHYVYRAEVDYRGYMIHKIYESCLYVCPESPGPVLPASGTHSSLTSSGVNINLENTALSPEHTYTQEDVKTFDLSAEIFFIGYANVLGLGGHPIKIVFSQEVIS